MNRVLIIKPSSMGDIIHALLVAEALQAQLPEVEIDWVVRREFAPLVELASVVKRSYIFERKGGVVAFIRLIREIRTQRYDLVLDMQGLARSGILTLCAKAPRKIGRSDAREGAGLAYSEVTASLPQGVPVHAAKILAGFLDCLQLDSTLSQPIRFGAPERAVELVRPAAGQRRIVIFPESRRAEKNWSGYEALTQRLLEQTQDVQVVWCGHVPFQAKRLGESERFLNLTGQTRIDQLPALLDAADCVVSNDSGPMHLAAALARPLVALFGPTEPERFGPFPANPDHQRVIRRADGDMCSVDVEEVLRAVFDVSA